MNSPAKGKLYYGWVVVAAILIICTVNIGARYSFGIFFKDIDTTFDLTRGLTSAILSIATVFSFLVNPFWGWLLDRTRPRIVTLCQGVLSALGFLFTSQANSSWQLFISYSLFIGMSDGMYATLMTTTSRWFSKGRGSAVGLAGSGSGFGVLAMAPLTSWILSTLGWRNAYLVMGCMILAVLSLVVLIKNPPATTTEPSAETDNTPAQKDERRLAFGHSFRESIRMRQFWSLVGTWFCGGSCIVLITTHLVPHATDLNIASEVSALIFSVMGGGYVAGRLLGGLVAPERRTTAALISAMLGMMAMIWLLWAKEPWSFYAFAIMLGISWGCLLNFVTLLVGDIFGMRKLGAIMGSIAAAWIAGSAVGPLVGGYIYDLTGSYSGAFIFGAAAMAGAALCLLLMKSPEGKPARVKTS